MNIQDFTDKWIAENVDTSDIYGWEVEANIRDFVALLIRQHHSGASLMYFSRVLIRFLNDYYSGDRMSK